ncbi:class I mannose-6-phosphate isomerase [Allokutzneria multivorans]|uniref:Class I mannose-6-phosphate isomerase n=1 Tax=Allokutzneria multivorans TaxID=1142134 RepID=A0ABP7TQ95_9PSEU
MKPARRAEPSALKPVTLAANQPDRFYRGGAAIAELRGAEDAAEWGPEDWVASITTLFAQPRAGLSSLPDGTLLRDAVSADPASWVGDEHAKVLGGDTALLVKLLDAGQRLPVHVHPSNSFARSHLGCRHGKTEAWVIVGTSGPNPTVYAGFRDDVDAATVENWVSTQDSDAMLAALNPIPVKPGDTVFVPAGLPHAIGEGVFIVELQQPTDFSVLLEWTGFAEPGDPSAHLAIGWETALTCVDRDGWGTRVEDLVLRTADQRSPVVPLFTEQASAFFRADRIHADSAVDLDPGFSVLVALEGNGTLRTEHGGTVPVRRGDTLVVPHSAGSSQVDGGLVVVRCRPPAPEHVEAN